MARTYAFSYTYKTRVPVVAPRPWWKLWGADQIEWRDSPVRRVVHGLSPADASLLQDRRVAFLLPRLLPDGAHNFQLELDGPATEYVPAAFRGR